MPEDITNAGRQAAVRNAPATSGPGNEDVCVVVPMLNEGGVIPSVIGDLRREFGNVICVDDGSRDDCGAKAETAGARVVTHPVNLGQGAAIQTGVKYALERMRGIEYIVTFDSDGQHRVADALRLVEVARSGEYDVVLGSRFLAGCPDAPLARRMLLRAAVGFTRLTTGLALTDTHNGLRVFTRRAAEALDIKLAGMAHASEILATVARQGLSFHEVPVEIVYSDYATSKGQPGINALNIVFDLLVERLRLAS